MHWLRHLRPGDWLTIVAGLLATLLLADRYWRGGPAARAEVRANGELVVVIDLAVKKELRIAGLLGETVIDIDHGRARVRQDPGPRQYCVQQGWLTRAGDVAVCAPNRVSLSIAGAAVDSTAY
jgi:hypothetical protein